MVQLPTEIITANEIDAHLARGWFRFGGTMRTTRFTVWEEKDLRTTLWTRTRMDGFSWSKSNRRLLRKVRRDFRIVQRPLQISPQHEALYAAYIIHVGGDRPASLIDFLGGRELMLQYDTQEIALYHGDELVAFCYFDLGNDSVMSLLGAFSPRFAHRSLGYATLILEIELARARGLSFHYSGYVLPGEPRMDYKLRPGFMEFLDPYTAEWRPWTELDVTLLPDHQMRVQLDTVGVLLARDGTRARRMLNPLFELAKSPMIDEKMVEYPILLLVGRPHHPFPLVTWDDTTRLFELSMGVPAVVRHRRSATAPEHSTSTAIIQDTLGMFSTAEELVHQVSEQLQ